MASFVFQGFSVIVCVCVCDGGSAVWPQMIMLGEQSTGGGNGLPLTNMDVCSVYVCAEEEKNQLHFI